MSASPFPDHYERTRVDSKEHPADVVIGNLPKIKRLRRRLLKLSEKLRKTVKAPKALIAYVDARGVYESMRENLFFNAGFEHGLLAARQDCGTERILNHPVAREVRNEINQIALSTSLPRNRVVMLLLEAAWAMVFRVEFSGDQSPTTNPELAAIRAVLWPGGDMNATWSPDTIDEIARIARPKKGGHHG
jgi:hypothetical protein